MAKSSLGAIDWILQTKGHEKTYMYVDMSGELWYLVCIVLVAQVFFRV